MRFTPGLALLTFGIVMLAGAPAGLAMSATRHDGTVESVDAKAHTLVIWELGANARARAFRVHVAPGARVMRSERSARVTDAQHAFRDSPIHLSDIKRGDFVVVDVNGPGQPAQAQSVVVTLRGGA